MKLAEEVMPEWSRRGSFNWVLNLDPESEVLIPVTKQKQTQIVEWTRGPFFCEIPPKIYT